MINTKDNKEVEYDEYYTELKEINKNVDKRLLQLVRKEFYQHLYVRKKIGNFKYYYNHDYTMKQFIENMAQRYGGIENMAKSLNLVSSRIAKEINKQKVLLEKDNYTRKQVKECVSIVLFFENYIKYRNIDIIKTALKDSEYFFVNEENEYHTDLIVRLKLAEYKPIGIKIKHINYTKASNKIKINHLNEQNKVNDNRYGTYFLFHNDKFKPMSIKDSDIMLFKNQAVCDENDDLYDLFNGQVDIMEANDYKNLSEQILSFFYKKNNVGYDDYEAWKERMKLG